MIQLFVRIYYLLFHICRIYFVNHALLRVFLAANWFLSLIFINWSIKNCMYLFETQFLKVCLVEEREGMERFYYCFLDVWFLTEEEWNGSGVYI
jgi:hypothetical protein